MTKKLRAIPILSLLLLVCLGSAAFASALIDPTTDPAGYLDQLLAVVHTNLWLTIGVAAFGAAELAAWFGRTFPKVAALAWFGKGRISIVIGGAIAVLPNTIAAAESPGGLQAALVAFVVAAAAYYHGAAEDVVKAKQAKKESGPGSSGTAKLALVLIAVGACGAATKPILHQLASCTESAVAKELQPTVQSILENGGRTWKQQLDALAVSFGEDELGCAVAAAEQFFSTKAGAAPLSPANDPAAAAAARAREYLSAHGQTSSLDLPASSKSVAIMWLGPPAPGCESPRERPAVDCKPFASPVYDGCRWTCEEQ